MKKLLIVLILSIYFIGCSNKPEPIINKSESPAYYQVTEHIWYIDDTGHGFCKTYEVFLTKDLPEGFNVSHIVGDGNGSYGRDRGYYIFLEEKNK